MNYGCCAICKQEIEDGEDLIVTGITITSGQSLADKNRTTEVHYAHQSCHRKRPDHVRDAVDANR